jgi:hypothetical protein
MFYMFVEIKSEQPKTYPKIYIEIVGTFVPNNKVIFWVFTISKLEN